MQELEKIKNLIGENQLMSLRKILETQFHKKSISFSFEPCPNFVIKQKGKRQIIIISKNYVASFENCATTETLAIGYVGEI